MVVGRVIGWLLILAALGVAGWELFVFFQGGPYQTLSLGRLWFKIAHSSLNLVQAVIQRYVTPKLWDPVLVSILKLPAWVSFAVLGIALIVVFRRRKRESQVG